MRLILAMALVAVSASAEAKTLYVDGATGSDATTYAANDAAHPWASIMRAAWGSTNYAAKVAGEAAAAGDTVLITAGIYETNSGNTTASGSRFLVQLNPVNSGTVGNPITFRGVGLVYIRTSVSPLIRGPMIGCYLVDYIIWDHFQIDDYYGGSSSDTGPVVMDASTGCQLINSDVAGHSGSYRNGVTTWTDNYNAIRLELCVSCVVKNNYIHRVWGTGSAVDSGSHNDAGVMTYRDTASIIEHNECYDVGVCVSIKGTRTLANGGSEADQHDTIIRFNYAHDTTTGFRVMLGQDVHIYQNISVNPNSWGLQFGYDGSDIPTASTRARIVNNTVYGQRSSIRGAVYPEGIKMVDVHVKNNIFHTAYNMLHNLSVTSPSEQSMTFDRNLYYNALTRHARWYSDYTPLNITFATWQSTYGMDTNGVNGSDPLFVNAGGSYALATDFKLQGGSPAATLGVDVLDLDSDGSTVDTIPAGAYITGNETIGIENSSQSTIFNPTINLRRSDLDILRDDFTAFRDEQAGRWLRVCAVLNRTRTTWAANLRREIPC